MILLTIGTQLPFDRLVKAVDLWSMGKDVTIVGQIGDGAYKPINFAYHDFLPTDEMNRFYDDADLIVSHAGMGTIITALRKKKPILVMPRMADRNEHRNDHQIATAKAFTDKGYIKAAFSVDELIMLLDKGVHSYKGEINEFASQQLLDYVKEFIGS